MNRIIPLSKSKDTGYQPFLGKYTVREVSAHSQQLFIELGTADEYFTKLTFNFMEFMPHNRLTAQLDLQDLQNVGKIDLFKQLYQDIKDYYTQEHGLEMDKLVDPKKPFFRTSGYTSAVILRGDIVSHLEGMTNIETMKEIYQRVEEFLIDKYGQIMEDVQPQDSLGNPAASHLTVTLRAGLYVIMESCQNELLPYINMQATCIEAYDHKIIEALAQVIIDFVRKDFSACMTYGGDKEPAFGRLYALHSFTFILDDLFKKNPSLKGENIEQILI